jgi:hypothetical protein
MKRTVPLFARLRGLIAEKAKTPGKADERWEER